MGGINDADSSPKQIVFADRGGGDFFGFMLSKLQGLVVVAEKPAI